MKENDTRWKLNLHEGMKNGLGGKYVGRYILKDFSHFLISLNN